MTKKKQGSWVKFATMMASTLAPYPLQIKKCNDEVDKNLVNTFSSSVSEILTDIEFCNAMLASMGFYRTTMRKMKKYINHIDRLLQ